MVHAPSMESFSVFDQATSVMYLFPMTMKKKVSSSSPAQVRRGWMMCVKSVFVALMQISWTAFDNFAMIVIFFCRVVSAG